VNSQSKTWIGRSPASLSRNTSCSAVVRRHQTRGLELVACMCCSPRTRGAEYHLAVGCGPAARAPGCVPVPTILRPKQLVGAQLHRQRCVVCPPGQQPRATHSNITAHRPQRLGSIALQPGSLRRLDACARPNRVVVRVQSSTRERPSDEPFVLLLDAVPPAVGGRMILAVKNCRRVELPLGVRPGPYLVS
jgi:hypothetical protein